MFFAFSWHPQQFGINISHQFLHFLRLGSFIKTNPAIYSLQHRLLLLGGWHIAIVGSCQFFGLPNLCSIFVELRISNGWLPKAPWRRSNESSWRFPQNPGSRYVVPIVTLCNHHPFGHQSYRDSWILNQQPKTGATATAEVSGCPISRYSSFLLFRLWPLLVWFATSVGRHAGHVTSFTASSWRSRSSTSMESQGARRR